MEINGIGIKPLKELQNPSGSILYEISFTYTENGGSLSKRRLVGTEDKTHEYIKKEFSEHSVSDKLFINILSQAGFMDTIYSQLTSR